MSPRAGPGSIGTTVYRNELGASAPTRLPPASAHAPQESLGQAAYTVRDLSTQLGGALLHAARVAFTHGFDIAAIVHAASATVIAPLARTPTPRRASRWVDSRRRKCEGTCSGVSGAACKAFVPTHLLL
jgi:hypothetical protein